MRLVISGPMRGLPLYNHPTFHMVEGILVAHGHTVANPARRDVSVGFDPAGPLDGFDLPAAMAWCFARIVEFDGVVFLPGWRDSEGATLEYAVAVTVGRELWEWVPEAPGAMLPLRAEPILAEAQRLVSGARQEAYGPPVEDFARTARLWSAYLDGRDVVTAADVGLMMVLLKVSREAYRPGRDNRVDIAGYAAAVDTFS